LVAYGITHFAGIDCWWYICVEKNGMSNARQYEVFEEMVLRVVTRLKEA